jgi:putative SOS response-associated peptidase YedK
VERLPDRSDAVAVRSQDGKRIPQQMRWGLVPWWAKDIKVGFSSINARAETVDTTRAFRDAWKKGQRCLVVTDGFYEWRKPEKQAYAIAMADKPLGDGWLVGRVDRQENRGARQKLYDHYLSGQCIDQHPS